MGKGKEKELHQVTIWGLENNNISIDNNEENKKWMHRETERQRRQEMGKLCATLRSLLPLEYIKGKRSTSDHMYEAVNYINQLQNKVKKLQAKRDELKKHFSDLNNNAIHDDDDEDESILHLPPYAVVHPLQGVGVEIICCYSFKKCLCPLSRLLHILIGEGLNIINTISTKKNGRFIHTIQSEDPNISSSADYSELQRKLTEAISSSSSLSETLIRPDESCLLYLDS
ncbi:transcription factor bHLH36-like [Arachis stenosperma]|uniref:transcription factor bHLH36-like n=1 Tax=Arachis stenosperma TaxID=217475 RepID=UPI0025ABC976|nr:transcription factor bHLH36-like [Arachis stenosperma]XP_057763004.1 transcription factor bHLH36-like [Arachis stenosperma]XP_057763005.1 transcription factor bHLH36-like [Arachis stenosperma]